MSIIGHLDVTSDERIHQVKSPEISTTAPDGTTRLVGDDLQTWDAGGRQI
jgi:hypothetical protein